MQYTSLKRKLESMKCEQVIIPKVIICGVGVIKKNMFEFMCESTLQKLLGNLGIINFAIETRCETYGINADYKIEVYDYDFHYTMKFNNTEVFLKNLLIQLNNKLLCTKYVEDDIEDVFKDIKNNVDLNMLLTKIHQASIPNVVFKRKSTKPKLNVEVLPNWEIADLRMKHLYYSKMAENAVFVCCFDKEIYTSVLNMLIDNDQAKNTIVVAKHNKVMLVDRSKFLAWFCIPWEEPRDVPDGIKVYLEELEKKILKVGIKYAILDIQLETKYKLNVIEADELLFKNSSDYRKYCACKGSFDKVPIEIRTILECKRDVITDENYAEELYKVWLYVYYYGVKAVLEFEQMNERNRSKIIRINQLKETMDRL
jgi:hypothetical protein